MYQYEDKLQTRTYKQQKGTHQKTFYEKSMHTDSQFRNHRYFTQQKIHTQEDFNPLSKGFVDLPPPLGVDNTYQYLRRIHKDKLPDLTPNTSFKKKQHSNNQSLYTSKQQFSIPISKKNSPKKIKALPLHPLSQAKVLIKFILFQQSNNDKVKQQVQLNVMKYLSGCFLKSSLNLEDITLGQYQLIEEFIPNTLKFSLQEPPSYIPRSLLGIDQMTSCEDLILKILQFKASNKIQEIYALVKYFILPSKQVMAYQMEFLLSDLNQLIQTRFNNITYPNYVYLHNINGKKINNLFEIDSRQGILIVTQNLFPPQQFIEFQNNMTSDIRKKQHLKRMQLFKSNISRDSTKYSPVSKFLQTQTNQIINSIFQKRKKTYTRIKYKDLFDSRKRPFIQKSKLIHEYQLFES